MNLPSTFRFAAFGLCTFALSACADDPVPCAGANCLDAGSDVGVDATTDATDGEDASTDDAVVGPGPGFFGERTCELTSVSFAGGEWSPTDTDPVVVNVDEVPGGFAVSGEGQSSVFASCEVVFDLDGATGTFREPQPCTDGVVRYERGEAYIVGDDFTIDVFGAGPFGTFVSTILDCGAGPLPPTPDDLVGDWTCQTSVLADESEQDAEFGLRFELNDSSNATGTLDFGPGTVCDVEWAVDENVNATAVPLETPCGELSTIALTSASAELDGDRLVGRLDASMTNSVIPDFVVVYGPTFSCER